MGRAIFYGLIALILLWSGSKLTPYAYGLYAQGKASEAWVPVEARVISFKNQSTTAGHVNSSGASNRSTVSVKVAYNYEYDGTEYSGDRTGFGAYSPDQLKRPRRGRATVYVNPQNPSESVYTKGISKNNLGGLAVAIGLLLGGLCFLGFAIKALVED